MATDEATDLFLDLTPEVVLDAIEAIPGCRLARMTGSGATCFGLFDDRVAAERAAECLSEPQWWVMPTVLATD